MTSTKERKARAEVYRKAARRIEVGENSWSCVAIEEAIHPWQRASPYWSKPTKAYRRMFGDDIGYLAISDFDKTGNGKNVRILALCFMAAMVEAGDA